MTFTTVAGDILAWAMFFGARRGFGWLTIGVVTVRAHKNLTLNGSSRVGRAVALLGIWALLLLGGWLIVDAVWAMRRFGRMRRLLEA